MKPSFIGNYCYHSNNISKNLSCNFIIENLNEKKEVSMEIKNIFTFDAEQWLYSQMKLTLAYYLGESVVSISDFIKVIKWCLVNLKSIEFKLKIIGHAIKYKIGD